VWARKLVDEKSRSLVSKRMSGKVMSKKIYFVIGDILGKPGYHLGDDV
jgi:hypothetical protein